MKNSQKSSRGKTKIIFAVGFVLLAASAVLGITLGSTPLSFEEIKTAFSEGFDATPGGKILLYVRLPRTLAAIVCGGALAVSGAVIQGVLANRLASPSIIGVNSGAGLAVTLCTAFGIYGGFRLSIAAFFGAFLAESVQERHQCALVGRLERFSAKQGQTVDIKRLAGGNEFIFGFFRKGLSVGEIPGFLIETILAVVGTAGHEE